MIIIKQYDNYILDEFDIVANELAETGNCDKEMFQKQINIDLNKLPVEWVYATSEELPECCWLKQRHKKILNQYRGILTF